MTQESASMVNGLLRKLFDEAKVSEWMDETGAAFGDLVDAVAELAGYAEEEPAITDSDLPW